MNNFVKDAIKYLGQYIKNDGKEIAKVDTRIFGKMIQLPQNLIF